jgi:hypothetical protein
MIGTGVEPGPMRGEVPDNPARGKAQGRIASGADELPRRRTADGSQSPEVDAIRIPGRPLLQISSFLQQAIGHPDENQSGRTREARTTGGPGPAEMPTRTKSGISDRATTWDLRMGGVKRVTRVHPYAGANLRRE